MQVRHLDGVKTNNSPDNLRWGTAKENGLDKVRLGESSPGEENGSAELSNADVVIVRTLLGKLPIRVIAELVGVTKSCINRIASGRGWVHIRADMPTLVARVEELESAIGAMLDYKDACDAADGASSELGDDTLTDMNHAAFRQLRAVMDRPEIVTKGSP